MTKTVIGKCSLCGGKVITDSIWMSTESQVPRCSSCGEEMDDMVNVPTVPMKKATSKELKALSKVPEAQSNSK